MAEMHKLVCLALLSGTGFAATGTFTFTGTATGTLGATPFTNASFAVSAPGDFTTVTCSSGVCRLNVAAGAATVTIGGVGSGTFTGTTYFFDNVTATCTGSATAGVLGFGTTADLVEMCDSQIASSIFTTYNLQSLIGPLGPQTANTASALAAFNAATTSAGALTVTAFNNFTFQVTPPAGAIPTTPAPTSLLLTAIGVVALTMWKLRVAHS